MSKLLEVKNLHTSFSTYAGKVKAVRGISFHVDEGEAVGIVGESGSGKSVTNLSILRLLPAESGVIDEGEVLFDGTDLLKLSNKEMRSVRGNDIAMIFQDPMTSLNPVLTIGYQIMEILKIHNKNMNNKEAKKRAVEMLRMVGIPSPESRLSQYPHEFSGGMRQRVMIAMALACKPKLLIADEPTTALDVTIQAQILDLMKDLKEELNTAIILITHDLGVVADLCSRILVMYGGLIVEEGTTDDIFYRPRHPYTWGLLNSIPKISLGIKEKLIPIEGSPPDLLKPPAGCPFVARCDYAMRICAKKMPDYYEVGEGHRSMCWLLHPDAPEIDFASKGVKANA